jgi:CRISPR/Cas system CSM-associated protein Csm2 small subunit
MTSAELTGWIAYERVYGSILPHERIDAGFAQLSFLMAKLWGKKKHGEFEIREFMPPWYQELTAEDASRRAFEAMLREAEANK